MRHFFKWVLGILVAALVAWGIFFAREDAMRVFQNARSALSGAFVASSTAEEIRSLSIENQSLRSALRAAGATSTFTGRYHYRVAQVYSRYPFNDQGMLIVNAGSADGVHAGMPVMASEGVLLGKVTSVERTESEVETIFSPGWKSSVAIGTSSVKAVLQGGAVPVLTLIPKEAGVRSGDEVMNLSPEYPLGGYVGTAGDAETVPNDVWQEANVMTLFKLEDVRSVLIVLDFP